MSCNGTRSAVRPFETDFTAPLLRGRQLNHHSHTGQAVPRPQPCGSRTMEHGHDVAGLTLAFNAVEANGWHQHASMVSLMPGSTLPIIQNLGEDNYDLHHSLLNNRSDDNGSVVRAVSRMPSRQALQGERATALCSIPFHSSFTDKT